MFFDNQVVLCFKLSKLKCTIGRSVRRNANVRLRWRFGTALREGKVWYRFQGFGLRIFVKPKDLGPISFRTSNVCVGFVTSNEQSEDEKKMYVIKIYI